LFVCSGINMYSILQLFWKFFLFDPTLKHIPICRSGLNQGKLAFLDASS
jgi:hypothetical protein